MTFFQFSQRRGSAGAPLSSPPNNPPTALPASSAAMSMPFSYTYYSCPCSDPSASAQAIGEAAPTQQEEEENEGKTFSPRSPRANFSLFPIDYLMWCEDCHDIKCQRCTVEEIVCWYCPNCLFETPSGMVKSDGNR